MCAGVGAMKEGVNMGFSAPVVGNVRSTEVASGIGVTVRVGVDVHALNVRYSNVAALSVHNPCLPMLLTYTL